MHCKCKVGCRRGPPFIVDAKWSHTLDDVIYWIRVLWDGWLEQIILTFIFEWLWSESYHYPIWVILSHHQYKVEPGFFFYPLQMTMWAVLGGQESMSSHINLIITIRVVWFVLKRESVVPWHESFFNCCRIWREPEMKLIPTVIRSGSGLWNQCHFARIVRPFATNSGSGKIPFYICCGFCSFHIVVPLGSILAAFYLCKKGYLNFIVCILV